MAKFSLFIPHMKDKREGGEIIYDPEDLVTQKSEAIKVVVWLVSEWNIYLQDIVNELHPAKRKKLTLNKTADKKVERCFCGRREFVRSED